MRHRNRESDTGRKKNPTVIAKVNPRTIGLKGNLSELELENEGPGRYHQEKTQRRKLD